MQVVNSVVSGDSDSGSESSEAGGAAKPSTSSLSREAMWRLVGTVERSSTHPIANAICEAATRHCGGGEHSLGSVEELTNFHEEPGLGVCCTVDNHDIVVGSKRWLEQNGVRVFELGLQTSRTGRATLQGGPDVEVETEAGMASEQDGTAAAFATNVCLAIDGVHRATITVGDRPRVSDAISPSIACPSSPFVLLAWSLLVPPSPLLSLPCSATPLFAAEGHS